ncbi:MAG: tRNA threonylcarbamoyladenosine dehydratase [Paludibacteraceae bacterium]|nr:tRNA threonylcarbamoyladenosine dehydratase [Paludibacteraceae bacterium]
MIMEDFFSRSEALLGAEGMDRLRNARVILFGVGGVGSWCAEALIRTGLTHLTIVDGDVVQSSNVNRQLPATRETIGRPKVEVLRERLLTINPEAEITAIPKNYYADGKTDSSADLQLASYDFLIDAIDSVVAKTDLIINATRVRGMKVFSSMGAALRFDPTTVTTGELMSIKGDALAKAVRARMKKIGLHPYRKVRCVYSTEQAHPCETRGSLMQVTAVFGCTLASMVINALKTDN